MPTPPRALDAAGLARAVDELTRRDSRLGRLVARDGLPPLWHRPTGFRTLVRIVLEQQVSIASAGTLFKRIDRTIAGGLNASTVARTGVDGLRALGLTRQKASYVHGLAEQVNEGAVRLGALGRLDDAAALDALTSVRGIGPWTAGIYLLMALRRQDVWPPGDLALHVALARLRRHAEVPRSADAARYAERWQPWRSVAARILWQSYLRDRSREV